MSRYNIHQQAQRHLAELGLFPTRGQHHNSVAAHDDIVSDGSKANRAEAIVAHIRRCGGGTDRQIAERMGFEHRSAVQPRITELIREQRLQEVGDTTCPHTGKRVRVVGMASTDATNG